MTLSDPLPPLKHPSDASGRSKGRRNSNEQARASLGLGRHRMTSRPAASVEQAANPDKVHSSVRNDKNRNNKES
jgi:hypothetical protein